jgi:hypothetical protein
MDNFFLDTEEALEYTDTIIDIADVICEARSKEQPTLLDEENDAVDYVQWLEYEELKITKRLEKCSDKLENNDLPVETEEFDDCYDADNWTEFSFSRHTENSLAWHFDEYADGAWNYL